MELYAVFLMTAFACGLCIFLFLQSAKTNLFSLRNVFMLVWFYYGFSVGIDLLTGVEIPYTKGEPDLMDPATWPAVVFVMGNYISCGLVFLFSYNVSSTKEPRAIDHRYDIRLPASWFLIAVHVFAGYAYISIFFGMTRMERSSLASISTYYKFVCLLVPLVLVLDIVIMTTSGDEKKSRLAAFLMLPLSLVTGHRTYVLFVFLIAAFRWRPRIRARMLMAGVLCGVFVFVGKTAYAMSLSWYQGEAISLAMFYEYSQLSLSDLDAGASYWIAMFYTQEPTPWWCGYSYVQLPMDITWPRFLGGSDVTTLAEDYVWRYHVDFASRGGGLAFSAIAEAWLNFGYFGSIILGAFWGVTARYFDNRPRGVAFYIYLLIVVRLFRSDFATLYKNWVLVWGSMFFVVVVGLVVYTVLAELNSPQRLQQLGIAPSPRPATPSRSANANQSRPSKQRDRAA